MHKGCFAGDSTPRNMSLAIVGGPQCQNIMVVMSQKDIYIGNEVKSKQYILTLKYFTEHSVVPKWAGMEKI